MEMSLAWDQEQQRFVFRGTNASRQEVVVDSTAVSCSCVQLRINPGEEIRVAPGAVLELSGVYSSKGRQGPQFEQIYLESGGSVTTLDLVIDLPILIEVVPAVMRWETASATLSPKTCRLLWRGPRNAELRTEFSSLRAWKAVVIEVEKGKTWEVTLRPSVQVHPGMHRLPLSFASGEVVRTGEIIAVIE